MLKFRGNVGVKAIEKVLKLLSRIYVRNIRQHLHFLFELVLQKSVVYSDYSFDVYPGNIVLSKVFWLEPRFDQIDAADIPFVGGLSLFESDVPAGLKLCLQPPNTGLVRISELFVDSIEHELDVVDFLFFQVVNLLQFFYLEGFLSDIVDLQKQVGQVLVQRVNLNQLGLLDEFRQGRKSSLYGFDSHVVIHFLSH
jgi:hypothetical protein